MENPITPQTPPAAPQIPPKPPAPISADPPALSPSTAPSISPDKPEQKGPAPSPSVLHTMHEDAEAMLRKNPPNAIEAIAKRADAAPLPRASAKSRMPLIAGSMVLILLMGIGGGIVFFAPSLIPFLPAPKPEPAEIKKPEPPPSFFLVERSEKATVAANDPNDAFIALIREKIAQRAAPQSITSLAITVQDGPAERTMTLDDFFRLARIDPPRDVIVSAESVPMIFFTAHASSSAFGLAVKTKDQDRALAGMIAWEPRLLGAFRDFVSEPIATTSISFQNRTFRNIDWRFLPANGTSDAGIAYMLFPAHNVLVLGTSARGMEDIIAKLFAAK